VVIAFLPALTSADAYQDAWISAIVAFFPSALIIFIIGKLATRFPDKSIIQYSKELLGPWTGGILVLFYLWLYLHMASTDLRMYAEIIKISFLTETPLVVIMGLMTMTVFMVVYHGLEPLGRCADIIFPLFFTMVILTLLVPLIKSDFINLEPVMARGLSPVVRGGIIPAMITAQYINLAMLTPSLNEPEKALRTALWSLVLSSLLLVFFAIIVVSVLGASEGARSIFPVFKMIRATRVSEFLERIEALTVFAWGLGLFITNAVNLYSGSKGLSQLLGMQNSRPLLLPMAVVWIAFGVQQYENMFEVMEFFTPPIGPPAVFFMLLFPPVILWGAYLIKSRT